MQPPDPKGALDLLGKLHRGKPASIPAVGTDDEGVILYGAGNLGKLAVDVLRRVGVPVKFALDRAALPGMILAPGVNVHLPHAVEAHESIPVLVTTVSAPFTGIRDDLIRMGWRKILPFYDFAQDYTDRHPLNNGWFSGPLSDEDRAGMESVLLSLADPASRAAYLQFLAWRVLREDWIFDGVPVTPDDKYFIGPVADSISDREDYVDVGAYDGRVFLRFLEITGNRFSSAVLIEPDVENMKLLNVAMERIPAEAKSRTRILPVAVSDRQGEISFSHGFDMASRVCDISPDTTGSIRLDDLDVSVSFLKLHIEGGEYRALRGGMKTLRNRRPIIVSTIYHNRDGLWKTISLLNESLERYELLLRLHSWCGTGFVMYWLPQERLLQRRHSRS